jgi:hypothetical protein
VSWFARLAAEERRQVGAQWRIAQAEQIREAMGSGMCAAFDALREVCGGDCKITWLDTATIQRGTPPGGEPIGERSFRGQRVA